MRFICHSARTVIIASLLTALPAAANGTPQYTFLVTDAEERFRRIASEFLERQVECLELVDLDGRLR